MGYEALKKAFSNLPLDEKLDLFNNFLPEEKVVLGQRILGGGGLSLTVILGSNNVVANLLLSKLIPVQKI